MAAAVKHVLDPENAQFLTGPVGIVAASRGRDNVPNLCRAVGCRVSRNRGQVTVFVSRSRSGSLLADIAANRAIAVVFTRPSTHRSLQLKGDDAEVIAPKPADLKLVTAYADAFVAELAPLGYSEASIRALVHCAPDDVAALSFTPLLAFIQTPGPKAGIPLQAAAQ